MNEMVVKGREFLVYLSYSGLATCSIYYGLIEKKNIFITFVCFHLICCLGIPVWHAWRHGNLRRKWTSAWKISIHTFLGVSWGLLSGISMMAVIFGGFFWMKSRGLNLHEMALILGQWGITTQGKWLFAFYMTVINSFFEEIFWRGFILDRLLKYLSTFSAILISSFFYSLYHFLIGAILFGVWWGFWATLAVFVAGLFWGWLKQIYKSIYPIWISHGLADFALMWILVIFILE
ncbi:CPBP family intramembrane glutamic endopeptidase [Brevibacillus daliensis]|uniref:CPBP family intramembrane glutamic endopeptidase n=1 Tax=Brevibacillus daliensis TaxID=2892995 RepID=UPI001E3513AE|nr:CPBP family intramembrane glutamic endopeptidase [Brevibacillus daliensis]